MPRLADYACEACEHVEEELFNDTDEQPEFLEEPCTKCGGRMKRTRNLKSNCQRWKFNDLGGI